MFQREQTYYVILGALILTFITVEILKPKPLDWTESFSSEDRIPYGGLLIHELLNEVYPNDSISINRSPIFEYSDTAEVSKNWIFMNKSFGLDQFETDILLSQIEQGSSVFIAARTYDQYFADSLGIRTNMNNPFLGSGSILDEDTTFVNFTNPKLTQNKGYPYYRSTTETYFSDIDSTLNASLLGINDDNNPNFIKISFGDGHIYLHTNPTLFTNYFVREKSGADYALTALSYLPKRKTIWDEYYKDVRSAGSSIVRYVVAEEYLRWAWIISLTGVVLFMIFRAKRKQRIIPEITTPQNTSIEFAKTIGDLYHEKGDHKLIAEKKVQFFYDYIRSHLNLNTDSEPEELIHDISSRSGVAEKEIESLLDTIDRVSTKEEITSDELKTLTDKIDQFYNQSER